jgi:hypothetical protein
MEAPLSIASGLSPWTFFAAYTPWLVLNKFNISWAILAQKVILKLLN